MPSQPLESLALSEGDVLAMAQRLCERDVKRASFCAGGGNNRVYRIETEGGDFALKLYGEQASNGHGRLRREFGGLRFLGDCGVADVPRAIASDEERGTALYEWVDGSRVAEHGSKDIERILEFLRSLRRAGTSNAAVELQTATEAVDCLSDLVEQIERRLRRLEPVISSEPQLGDFIAGNVLPELERRLAPLEKWDRNASLATAHRTLSPSDFGFHNALRREDESLCFIDFEYFGWDDPVKLVADFLLHPAMDLAPSERRQFFNGVAQLYGNDATFLARLMVCFPLYGIRWVLIILNEFIPEIWARRAFSGKGGDWERAKRLQLEKARQKMAAVRTHTEAQFSP